MKKIAIFASGNGSNAENIIKFFQSDDSDIEVVLVICNRKDAGVYERAHRLNTEILYLPKSSINDENVLMPILEKYKIDFIVLAGFMLMIPSFILSRFPNSVINIHPSLLPKYGGKGMYGKFVHEAVVAAGEKESGITIHRVTDKCDEGEIIFQTSIPVSKEDTPESVEQKIHRLEKEYFPKVIKHTILLKK
ncbi:MAG: phosphoribosylglycinamide formyltransferase [Muribaculaceae bacterium]|nr:phosphoribosylglycinamide formyltransferase [Muribaculaceae bacterium]